MLKVWAQLSVILQSSGSFALCRTQFLAQKTDESRAKAHTSMRHQAQHNQKDQGTAAEDKEVLFAYRILSMLQVNTGVCCVSTAWPEQIGDATSNFHCGLHAHRSTLVCGGAPPSHRLASTCLSAGVETAIPCAVLINFNGTVGGFVTELVDSAAGLQQHPQACAIDMPTILPISSES